MVEKHKMTHSYSLEPVKPGENFIVGGRRKIKCRLQTNINEDASCGMRKIFKIRPVTLAIQAAHTYKGTEETWNIKSAMVPEPSKRNG